MRYTLAFQVRKKTISKMKTMQRNSITTYQETTAETLTRRLFSQAFTILKKENIQHSFCSCNAGSSPVFLFTPFLICHSGRCKTSLSANLFLALSLAPDSGCLPFFITTLINGPKNCLCFQVNQRLHPAVPGIPKFLLTPNVLSMAYVLFDLSVKGTEITHGVLNLDHF